MQNIDTFTVLYAVRIFFWAISCKKFKDLPFYKIFKQCLLDKIGRKLTDRNILNTNPLEYKPPSEYKPPYSLTKSSFLM